eukprot:m.186134 g.186134  ORF g.186134 m.186134 type:complete len:537 (-) comp17506_c0_seq2:470-2080(-)
MADSRMKDFKNKGKDNDEMRGRRRDQGVELRKAKREEQMQKKRQVEEEDDSATVPSTAATTTAATTASTAGTTTAVTTTRTTVSLSDLPMIVEGVTCSEFERVLQATTQCRMLLSKHQPPIDAVIETGVVPYFVKYLSCDDYPRLQFEAAWALTNIASGNADQTAIVVREGAIPMFIRLLRSQNEEVREQAVWALGNIAGDGPALRDYVLSIGMMQPLLELIHYPESKTSMVQNATWALSNLCRGKNPPPDFEKIRECIPTVARLLHHESEEVLTDACWAASYLTDGENTKIQAVIEAGMTSRLVELLNHPSSKIQTPALRAVGNIATGDDRQTQTVLDSGALQAFVWLLRNGKDSIKKETCWTISNITAGTRQQIQAVLDANLGPLLAHSLRSADFKTRKEAAWAIANLTTGGTPEQTLYMVDLGCIGLFVQMLQCNDAKIIQILLDGLSNILRAGQQPDGSNHCADLIEECGGLEAIEELQTHDNEEVYRKSLGIIERYFSEEDEEAADMPMAAGQTFGFTNQVALVATGGFNF